VFESIYLLNFEITQRYGQYKYIRVKHVMAVDILDMGMLQMAALLSAADGHICSMSAQDTLLKKCSANDICCQTDL
jgi:hypothetical protein